MVDKMIRVSGRDEKGLAKPIKIAKNGGLSVERTERFFMEEIYSGARTVLVGGSWESDVFSTGGLTDLSFFASLNLTTDYSLEIVEMISDGTVFIPKDTNFLLPPYIKGSTNGKTQVIAPYFKIVFKNLGSVDLKMGLYLYMK